jgi:peptide/nickel transport system ATP-binding protein/oligopeptide transport system ATP-binding protein
VLNLLARLQAELGLTLLFVAHDLAAVQHVSDRIAVMYLGRIVEFGDRDQVTGDPAHPYTRALLSAVPVPDPPAERRRRRIVLAGDVPDPADPPSGCRFRTRCPEAFEACPTIDPALQPVGPGGTAGRAVPGGSTTHEAACLLHGPAGTPVGEPAPAVTDAEPAAT